jgi:hypothetical protein
MTVQALKAANVAEGKSSFRFARVMALSRPPTPCLLKLGKKDVDARDKRGYDGRGYRTISKRVLVERFLETNQL